MILMVVSKVLCLMYANPSQLPYYMSGGNYLAAVIRGHFQGIKIMVDYSNIINIKRDKRVKL